MGDKFVKKGLAVGIIVLFIGAGIASSSELKNYQLPLTSGKTIYVDDDNTEGPWDGTMEHPYMHIQDGVDNASEGDTVYVFNGTYIERVWIYAAINLIGEDRDCTIIDADGYGCAIRIKSNYVNVSGFTTQNSGNNQYCDAGVSLGSIEYSARFCNIIGNRMVNNLDGLYSLFPWKNNFEKNIITNNRNYGIFLHGVANDIGEDRINEVINNFFENNSGGGICIYGSRGFNISNNIFNNTECGIKGSSSNWVNIYGNTFTNNIYGISLEGCGGTNIYRNSIVNNQYGLLLDACGNNDIKENNFVKNNCHADFFEYYPWTLLLYSIFRERFNRNYWDDHLISIPKLIKGKLLRDFDLLNAWFAIKGINIFLEPIEMVWFFIDWHPAKEPYEIGV